MPSSLISFAVRFLSKRLAALVVQAILQKAVTRADNTVDAQVVDIVNAALAGRLNPIQRVVGK